MSVSQWMDKQNVYPYIGIFFSHKKIWCTDTCNNMNKAWKHCAEKKRNYPEKSIVLKERIQTQKVTYCMIPFICKVQSRQIHRDRKQIGSFQELGEKGKWRWSSNEYEVSFLSVEMFSD